MLLAGVLAGCSKDAKKPGQALVRVNGEEITTLQLHSELQRAGVPVARLDAARVQLLESLIDRHAGTDDVELMLCDLARVRSAEDRPDKPRDEIPL